MGTLGNELTRGVHEAPLFPALSVTRYDKLDDTARNEAVSTTDEEPRISKAV
jgi:hypothetical protein